MELGSMSREVLLLIQMLLGGIYKIEMGRYLEP